MDTASGSVDDQMVTLRDKTANLPIQQSGCVDDKIFFGPITEREKKARHLFQQRYGLKEPDLSVLDNMNDYLLNDSQSRQSMSLLGEISESPVKITSHRNEFDKMDHIAECTYENISQTDSIQDLCMDIKNLNMSRPKYETHPDYSYIKIDPNYSLISEPEPRTNNNFQPNLEGLSILSEAALIHSSQFSKSSEESHLLDSIDGSKCQSKNNFDSLKVTDTTIAREESVIVPKFNDTLEALEELLSKRNQKESLAFPDTTSNLSDSPGSNSYQQTSFVNTTPIKYEQNMSNSKCTQNLEIKSSELPKIKNEKKLSSELNYNNTLDSMEEFLSRKNEEVQSQIYPDSTSTFLNNETMEKHVQTINEISFPNQDSYFKVKNNQNLTENDYSPNLKYDNTLEVIDAFLSEQNQLEKPTPINSYPSSSTASTPCNKKSSSSKIPLLSSGNYLKEKIKPKLHSSNIIRTPMSKEKMTTPFKTPTQLSAHKPKKTPKFGHIISPVAAYINKPSPRLKQNIKYEQTINESKLTTPTPQKENMDKNNVSIQFPKVDYKQGPRIFLEEKTNSRFPHNLSPMMQNNLPESSPIACKHIGHLRIDGNNFENEEFSMIVRKN